MNPANLTKQISIIILLNSFFCYSQNKIETCDQATHIYGNAHCHINLSLNCNQDITITSTTNETLEGSIISGDIITTGSIIILPGEYKVRIIPSHSNEQNKQQTHRDDKTRLGGAGNGGAGGTGDRQSHEHILDNSLMFFPNPAKKTINFTFFKGLIISYEIIDIQGYSLLKGTFNKHTTNHKVNIENLTKGFYVVNMILTTGETTTRALIKQ